MHAPDADLIIRAQARLNGGCTHHAELAAALWDYRIACRLSRGADLKRSWRWGEIAAERHPVLVKVLIKSVPLERVKGRARR